MRLARVTGAHVLLVCAGCCAVADPRGPGPRPGEWGIAAGVAAVTPDFDAGTLGGALELDWFATSHVTASLRHLFDYRDNGSDTSESLTRFGAEWSPWGRARLEPFVGLAAGLAYGESVNESVLTGVHGGVRWWQQPRAFVQVLAGYDAFWTTTEDTTEYYGHDAFTLVVGVGLLF